MKFLADEDFPKPVVNKIRQLGHSVKTIQKIGLSGSSDETVVKLALREKRIIITFDKDFLKDQPKQLERVIFRFPKTPTNKIIILVENFLEELTKVKGNIAHEFDKFGLKPIQY